MNARNTVLGQIHASPAAGRDEDGEGDVFLGETAVGFFA